MDTGFLAPGDLSACSCVGSGPQERDEAVERVVAVEVLKLLAAEGVHAPAVLEVLTNSEVWRAYKDQKHDLFLPAGGSQQVTLRMLSRQTIQNYDQE